MRLKGILKRGMAFISHLQLMGGKVYYPGGGGGGHNALFLGGGSNLNY